MRRPIAPITAWTCLLLVYLLPAQSMHNFQDAENLGHLASAPHPATDFGQVGHDASDLNRHPAPSNPEHQAEELYPRPYGPQPNPRIPKNIPLRKQLNPIPHLNKLKQKLLERIVVPEFLQKIYKVMTRGFIHLEKPEGKLVRVPVYATRKRTPEWKEMEKDATEMIDALKNFEDQHYLTQLQKYPKLFKLAQPAFKPPSEALDEALHATKLELPEQTTIDLILKARNELEKLGGKATIFRTKHKERQILLVKTLVILSRKPAYRGYAVNAIEALVNNLKLRENPEALPKIMPYIEAAHYLITTPKEPLDSPGLFAQRFLESNQIDPSFKKILEQQNLESWLKTFATEGSSEVHQKYERMLESNAEGSERFHEILQWSSEVLHPGNRQRYTTNDVTFALETLYVHSVQKPEGLGGHNPALERLLHARHAWQGSFHPDKAVPAAIELTVNSAIEKKATIVNNKQLLGILNEHKKEFTSEEIP